MMKFRSLSLGVAIAAATLMAMVTGPAVLAAESPSSCPNGHWPATVEGRPTLLAAGTEAGDYLWHDNDGWHLRVTHRGQDRLVFTGRIQSSAPLAEDPVKLEPADQVSLSADRKTITFRFTNYGAIDGVDFTTACAQRLTFHFEIAGVDTPVGRIWLGHANRHPLQNPFVVTRIV
jgi:hypothetical protein